MFGNLKNSMGWRATLPAIGVSLLLSCSPAQAGLFDKIANMGQPKRLELTDSTDNAATFVQAFSDGGALTPSVSPADFALRKIAIASFQIEFVTEQLGTGSSSNATAVKTYTLKGITDAQMQAVTDKMYSEFGALLAKRGFEVVPTEALMNTSFKAELTVPNEAPVHYAANGSITDAAYAVGVISHSTGADNQQASVTVTAKGTAPNAFETKFMSAPAARKAADELGIAVVQARLKIGFMQIDEAGGLSADVEGKPRNILTVKDSRSDVFWPEMQMARFELKKPVLLPSSASDKMTELGMTTTEKVGTVAKGAFGIVSNLLGKGSHSSGMFVPGSKASVLDSAASVGDTAYAAANSGHFEVTADADYEEKISKDIKLALEMYAEALPR